MRQDMAENCYNNVIGAQYPGEGIIDKYLVAEKIINECESQPFTLDLRELGDRMINLKAAPITAAYQKVSQAFQKKKSEGGDYSTLESIHDFLYYFILC